MGSGIAEVAARSGCDVKIVENNDGALQAGMQRIEKSLDRAMRAGKLSEEDHAQDQGDDRGNDPGERREGFHDEEDCG